MNYQEIKDQLPTEQPPAISPRPTLAGIFSKKQLSCFLFPHARRTNTRMLRKILFTPDCLAQMGLTVEQYKQRRTFTAEECSLIVARLRKYNLHP